MGKKIQQGLPGQDGSVDTCGTQILPQPQPNYK